MTRGSVIVPPTSAGWRAAHGSAPVGPDADDAGAAIPPPPRATAHARHARAKPG